MYLVKMAFLWPADFSLAIFFGSKSKSYSPAGKKKNPTLKIQESIFFFGVFLLRHAGQSELNN